MLAIGRGCFLPLPCGNKATFNPPPTFFPTTWPHRACRAQGEGWRTSGSHLPPELILRHRVQVSALKFCPSPTGIRNVQRWSDGNSLPLELLLLKSCRIQWIFSLVFSGFMKFKVDCLFSLTLEIFSQGFLKFTYLLSLLFRYFSNKFHVVSIFAEWGMNACQNLKSKLGTKLALIRDTFLLHISCVGRVWTFFPVCGKAAPLATFPSDPFSTKFPTQEIEREDGK